ncbi:hypothetical protein HN51_069144 [Arachis hypogaea]|uniref:F-box domain-containing protein n=1 Tax=Arachis hypogaea TaxID=3818 RepID=A0A444Z7I6_ARAHY|nr:F-box/LRR-repeat protein At3g59190-like [Arachis ipaensis]XP_025654113.1 F-box/LRR-repeat protein At3g59190 [Arachis hypogaea]QHO11356.1 F-box/LRR-repeat protein [Arachis hypogaea]RYR10098.1 hypothetical protein Ahy_B05g078568 [Arachis hypogaea]
MGDETCMKKNKKKRLNRRKEENKGTNISDLPNALICEILSNLPTKEAIRTSVLSKQWRHQWKNIYKFELKEESHDRREDFKDFVKRLLRGCNNSLGLKKFCLSCDVGEDAALINIWLMAFISSGIEELILDFESVTEQLYFPEGVFDSPTLKKFHLSMPFALILPLNYNFKNLKELTLKHVVFQDAPSTQQLFSSCRSLQDLTLVDCNWMNVRTVCICSPSLQNLTIREWNDDDEEQDEEEEENGRNQPPPQCQIVIIGSKLKTFSYDGDMANHYFFYCTASVVNASVCIRACQSSLENAFFVFKMLKAFPSVEKLSITDAAIETLCHAPCLIQHLPRFNKLTQLRVQTDMPMNFPCAAFITLLRNSPCLQTLEFDNKGIYAAEEGDGAGALSIPAGFGTHLKKITISGFSGNSLELNAIKYLLREMPALEEFNIYSSAYVVDSVGGVDRLEDLYNKILAFPRASQDCDLYLE